MKKTLSMILVAIMVMAMPIALADTEIEIPSSTVGFGLDLTIDPSNRCPEITNWTQYDVTTWYELSTPTVNPGILSTIEGWISTEQMGRSYAFEGELISINFSAVDQDGVIDECTNGYMTLDCGYDPRVVQCAKTVSGNKADFVCNYFVEGADQYQGECWVSVSIEDACQQGCNDKKPGILSVYLNPAVGITYSPQIQQGLETAGFGFLYTEEGDLLQYIVNGQLVTGPMPGTTAFTPFFTVENSADEETGLYILLQMYGTDFVAPSSADPTVEVPMCKDPKNGNLISNVLSIQNVEYMARHLNVEQGWTPVQDVTTLVFDPAQGANFLGVGDDITMRLRINIPSPCEGDFSQGGEIMFVATVI